MSDGELAEWVTDARARTLALVADLTDEQLVGPRLPIVNPLGWEIGHVAWFQERWVLRVGAGLPPLRADGDALWDSSAIPHDARWELPLPTRAATLAYLGETRDRVLERIARGLDDRSRYFVRLAVFHEDMHGEAFAYTRQTHGWPAPPGVAEAPAGGALPGDVEIAGGVFSIGASRDEPFVFDNEKWAHRVELAPFAIARAPVTQAELAAFADDRGYRRRELWSDAGWAWRAAAGAEHPVYWHREGRAWLRRHYDRWVTLEPHRPALHVNFWEADAFCRWAGRRLPTEAEWEVAAAQGPGARRPFPWGEAAPDATRAHLGRPAAGCAEVGALPAGDSASGCRQMTGNVWEWTASDFLPYPGFVADPYEDYSRPWFGTHKVLRGGCFVTQPRLLRNTWRNFYLPDRRDVWCGFRTCAVR